MAFWDNPDVDLLYGINDLAQTAPTWADRTMEYVGEYGIVGLLLLMCGWVWWRGTRRRDSREEAVAGFAGLLWAPLSMAVALLLNIPIRDFVARPRPFVEHRDLDVLVDGKNDFSFVSDHATMAMALAVGIFMVQRRHGLLAILLAVAAGFTRVYMGVHYPTDVVGGLALGTAVALLLAPVAMWLLTPVVRAVAGTRRGGALVWAGGTDPRGGAVAHDAGTRRDAGRLEAADGARPSTRRRGRQRAEEAERGRDLAA